MHLNVFLKHALTYLRQKDSGDWEIKSYCDILIDYKILNDIV